MSEICNLQFAIMQFAIALFFMRNCFIPVVSAADLTVELGNSQNVTFVGAIQRWDQDGNHRKLPDPKAKIDAPAVDATAEKIDGNKWVFKNLPAGKYDLVISGKGSHSDRRFSIRAGKGIRSVHFARFGC